MRDGSRIALSRMESPLLVYEIGSHSQKFSERKASWEVGAGEMTQRVKVFGAQA